MRHEPIDPLLQAEIEALPRPRVYASLGSFMSTRADVLARIADAFRNEPASLILASGVTDPGTLAPEGSRHVVRSYLPQVGMLPFCDLVICHGGNNTITEALYTGLPLLAAIRKRPVRGRRRRPPCGRRRHLRPQPRRAGGDHSAGPRCPPRFGTRAGGNARERPAQQTRA